MLSQFLIGSVLGASLASALRPEPPLAPGLPPGRPYPPPAYMMSNVDNIHGFAPDRGVLTGPVVAPLNASTLREIHNQTWLEHRALDDPETWSETIVSSRSSGYWMQNIVHGNMPLATPTNYQFFRNVKDFNAKGDGVTDDTAAINRAASSGGRCGADCGSTTVYGALVYFPPGIYKISTPIIQYYYTQFVGDPTNMPIIRGSANFSGIALVDTDFYIPGGDGAEWYINQSNFYRQIRNIVFDMYFMNCTNMQGDQMYVPTGIHWQVGQATSITNCYFNMSFSDSRCPSATGVGIFMENGSGGFVSDLTFKGGHIGFSAGSQQFTARNLTFINCLTAVSQIWNWGFNWQNVYVNACYIGFDCSLYGGATGQGTGSISVVDSLFHYVPYGITTAVGGPVPNVVIDNLLISQPPMGDGLGVVLASGGPVILPNPPDGTTIESWAMGLTYTDLDGTGRKMSGYLNPPPKKPAALLDSTGKYFTQSKPQYLTLPASSFIVATANGISNNMTGDQTAAINSLLSKNVGSVIFFPAGIYLVRGTVNIPVGTRMVGEGWSQFMATGAAFQDQTHPMVLAKVGNAGDKGVIQISDMLFTVQGPTAGCILMEWNVHESTQGSAAMWDSHFRVGGAAGTNLQLSDCPAGMTAVNKKCMASSMLLHVTSKASGYFENVWGWVADHDLDNHLNAEATEGTDGIPHNVYTQISIYSGRGFLIESQGPTWLWGTSSEHSQMYQYQLNNANNIFLGHMQTETPYYQPNPVATKPFSIGMFPNDPTFTNCATDSCKQAWALRVLSSTNVFVYSAGFYDFFQNNQLGCANQEDCQQKMVETNYIEGFWLYNLFTKGNVEIISPMGAIETIFFNDTTRSGYTSEIAAWLSLALGGENIGSPENSTKGGSGIVYIDPIIWVEPQSSRTAQCQPPCTIILPPVTLQTPTTITFPPYSTSLEVGWFTTRTTTISGTVETLTGYTSITEDTVLSIPPVTKTTIPVWNTIINATVTSTTIHATSSIVPPPFVITDDPNPLSQTGVTHPRVTRTITPPPYPYSQTTPDLHFPPIAFTIGPAAPLCQSGCGSICFIFCAHPCLLDCPGGIGSIGNGASGFPDPNDPNYPAGVGGDGECTTSRYRSCSTLCTASPTKKCSSTCKTVIGCKTTGTSTATTVTPPTAIQISQEQWPTTTEPVTDVQNGAAAIFSELSSYGDYPSTTKTTTTAACKPSGTPVKGPVPDYFALNVYSDTQCKKFVAGYMQSELGSCTKMPCAVRSYQFVSEGDLCNQTTSDKTEAALLIDSNCALMSSVGGGCGDVQSCQSTDMDQKAMYIIAYLQPDHSRNNGSGPPEVLESRKSRRRSAGAWYERWFQ